MLTDRDINKLITVFTPIFATKQDFIELKSDFIELKSDVIELKETVGGLVTAMDGLIKVVQDLRVEYVSISHQLTRHDRWIHQVADKTDVILTIDA